VAIVRSSFRTCSRRQNAPWHGSLSHYYSWLFPVTSDLVHATSKNLVKSGDMNSIGYGVDVSAHNDPASLPWGKLDGNIKFGICRAGYGSELRDKHVEEHARRFRELAVNLGLYFFFRNFQSVQKQFDLLCSVADAVRIGEGDIFPAVDIELDPFPAPRPVTSSWSGPAEEFTNKIVERFGNALIYITRAEWKLMGSPQWVLERPLWVANYSGAAAPYVPGDVVPTIWQHRVDVFEPNGAGGYNEAYPALDQSRLILPLPIIGLDRTDLGDDEKQRLQGLIALTAAQALHPDEAPEERLRAA
jgi:GH25 family lysozyme M1 (1,4-beta-N-acetylmuramidase)